jgi:RNA polymerase sigma-70 factor, ECF subfamily
VVGGSSLEGDVNAPEKPAFYEQFAELFETHFQRLYRYLDRLSGDPDVASDLAQETFVRLFRRGALPDVPEAWLISVALNLFRNHSSGRARRTRLLTLARSADILGDAARSPEENAIAAESRDRVREVINRMPRRDRELLLLSAEGYGYREMAAALGLHEASVGTLLARARRTFRKCYEAHDAP